MPQGKVVVLGGGLSGIAASFGSGAPVYEADSRAGGVATSDSADGFTFDRGIHVLQTRRQKVLSLLEETGVQLLQHTRHAYIYYRGRYTEYPFQVNSASLPLIERARCVTAFLRRHSEPPPANYEEWINRSVGRGFASTFLIPYSEKFWTIHPREMTFEWTGSRVPQPTTWQVLRGAIWSKRTAIGTNASFRYPAGLGYGSIAQRLADRAGRIYLDHRAIGIDTAARRIHFDNGSSADYDTLISSIPLKELIPLCSQAPEPVRDAAARLRTNSIFVVNLGIGREDRHKRHWVHFPEKDISFFRISFPHHFNAVVAPRGTSSISAEVAYSNTSPLDKASATARVIEDLRRVGILGADDPIVSTATRDIKYAYCIYDGYRKEALRIIHQWLRTQNILPCGRYGLWTYFWSDEAILSGLNAAAAMRRRAHAPLNEIPAHAS